MILKGKLNFLLVQLFVLWNFSQESIHSGSTSKSNYRNIIILSTVKNKAGVTVATTNGTLTLSRTAVPKSPLQIVEFSVTTLWQPAKTRTQNLMNQNGIVSITPFENNMRLTCAASGNPEPEITILHNNIPIKPSSSRGEASHVVENITCQDSGVYTCRVTNRFNSTQIQKTIKVSRSDNTESYLIQPSIIQYNIDNEKLTCRADICSEPVTMTIVDGTETVTKTVHQDESLVHEIRNVQCSDLGSYFCRMESKKNDKIEQLDLQISRCTSAFQVHNNSVLPSQESTNYIYIVIIVVLVVIVIAQVICVLVYRYRGSAKKDNSKDSHINLGEVISPCARYEEAGNVDAVLPNGSGEQTKKTSSDVHGGEFLYDDAVTLASSVDAEDNYEEVKYEPPGALHSYKHAKVKHLTEYPEDVEYENTRCVM